MTIRKKQVEELMESFQSLRRSVTFRPLGSSLIPRITPSQWGVLMIIGQRGGCTVKDVAKALGISSSAATQLIDGLVTSGYVMRKTDSKDRRVVLVSLSTKSKAHMEKMKKQMLKKFLQFFDALNDKEFDQYVLLSKKITNRFSTK